MMDDLSHGPVLAADSWELHADSGCPGKISFKLDGSEVMKLQPVSFGVVGEATGILKKCREHVTLDDSTHSLETMTLVPFGPEPLVSRKIEIFGNSAQIVTDVELRHDMQSESMSIDGMLFPGEWKRISVVPVPADEFTVPEPVWQGVKADTGYYESDHPFLVCLLEDAQGKIFEVGTGDDLWRWRCAERVGCVSNFTVSSASDGIEIVRKVIIPPEGTAIPPGNRRFKWYFSWKSPQETEAFNNAVPLPSPGKKYHFAKDSDTIFDFTACKWPENALCKIGNKTSEFACWHSSIVSKHLRYLVRAASAAKVKSLTIINASPHLCDVPSHLERPNKKSLPHWDIMQILAFRTWASRQLAKNDGVFRGFP